MRVSAHCEREQRRLVRPSDSRRRQKKKKKKKEQERQRFRPRQRRRAAAHGRARRLAPLRAGIGGGTTIADTKMDGQKRPRTRPRHRKVRFGAISCPADNR